MDNLDRRELLKVTGSAALAAVLAELLPGSFLLRVAQAQEVGNATVHLASTEKGASYADVKAKIKAALQATRDLDLIKAGDLVVIKVVSNSPYKYPMVTHPWALQAVIEIAKEHTDQVRVVDQVGFEHAFFTGDDELRQGIQDLWQKLAPGAFISTYQQVSSGMEALERNGLKEVAEKYGAQIFSGDHDDDYLQVPNGDPQYGQESDPEFAHWTPWKDIEGKEHPRGFRVNKSALGWTDGKPPKKAPHVISISRISAHIWAGTTGPTKAYYGWIHPQDRVHSHTDIDPLSKDPINVGGHLVPGLPHPQVRTQAERITEVAAFFQRYMERVRANTYYANLVVALDTYSDIGPDWGVQPLPDGERGIIGASEDVVALDAVATAKLVDAIRSESKWRRDLRSAGDRYNPLNWFTAAGRDRTQNAWQTLSYSNTRGLWNTFFGSATFLQQIDKQRKDPNVWEVGQVKVGVDMGLAKNPSIDFLDEGAKLNKSQAALLARPDSPGLLKKLDDASKEKK